MLTSFFEDNFLRVGAVFFFLTYLIFHFEGMAARRNPVGC